MLSSFFPTFESKTALLIISCNVLFRWVLCFCFSLDSAGGNTSLSGIKPKRWGYEGWFFLLTASLWRYPLIRIKCRIRTISRWDLMSAEAFSLCLNPFSVATLQIWRRCVSCWGSSSRCWRGRSATAQWRLKWRKSPRRWMWPRSEADWHLFHLLITHTHGIIVHRNQRAISSRWLALLAADSVPLLHDNVCIIHVQYSSWKFKCRSYFRG